MDEIRFVAGPIIQRHLDKIEAERQAARQKEEEIAMKKQAEIEAKKRADEDAKRAAEEAAAEKKGEDTEMKDADGKPEVEEAD
jgi:heat shock protein 4